MRSVWLGIITRTVLSIPLAWGLTCMWSHFSCLLSMVGTAPISGATDSTPPALKNAINDVQPWFVKINVMLKCSFVWSFK